MTAVVNSNSIYSKSIPNENFLTHSPPSNKIIQNIHPKTVDLLDSTKRLSHAPFKHKDTDLLKKMMHESEQFQNSISLRFLKNKVPGNDYKPEFLNESSNENDVVEVKAVIDGMTNTLAKLNKIIRDQEPLPKETISEKSFGKIVFHNSLNALCSFVNIKPIHSTDDTIIYSATNRFDKRNYVIKSALIDNPWDNCKTLTFPNLFKLREAQVLSAANHSNIVRFHGVWFENQAIFLQLEYMIGASLHYIWYGTNKHNKTCYNSNIILPELTVQENRLSINSARKLIQDMAKALDYLHNDLKLVHNHINSPHIFAAYNGIVRDRSDKFIVTKRTETIRNVIDGDCENVIFKLFDFGRSYAIDEPPIPRTSLNTKFLNNFDNDPFYKDICSLGIVLAEAFLKREEFYEMDFMNDEIYVQDLTKDDELNNVLAKLLATYQEKHLTATQLIRLVRHW